MKFSAPRKRVYAETKVQNAIVEYLRLTAPQCITFHIPNGGSRSDLERMILSRMGVLPGIPDLQIIVPGGRAYFLEVKADNGKPSKAQRELFTRFMNMSQPYAVVKSIDDVRVALAAWKIETKDSSVKSLTETGNGARMASC